jgi:hypothetical protein
MAATSSGRAEHYTNQRKALIIIDISSVQSASHAIRGSRADHCLSLISC